MKTFLSTFFTLPMDKPDEPYSRVVLLTLFLWGFEIGGLILALLFWATKLADLSVFPLLLLAEGVMFGLHFMLIKRKAQWVGWVLPIIFLIINTMALLTIGNIHHVSQINYIFILALVALTLGEWAVVSFGLATILIECGLYLAETSHFISPKLLPTTIIDFSLLALSIGMTTWILQVGVREIARGFRHARERALQLDQLNTELENRVGERTRQFEQANQELKYTKEQLEYLLASNPSVIYSGRATGDFGTLYVSPNLTCLLGYPPHLFIENPALWKACLHPEDAPAFFAKIPLIFEQGFFTHEYRFLHQDGTYRWLRDDHRLIKDRDDNPVEIVGSLTDITEHKNNELALQTSEQRYRVLFENNLDAILLTRPTGEILFANPAACELFGYTENELRNMGRQAILDPTDHHQLAELLSTREHQGRARGELRFLRKDGSVLTGEISSTIYNGPDGLPLTSTTIRDVTEARAAETALRRSEALLNATNQIARIGGWELDLRNQTLYWTNTVKEIHEVPFTYEPNLSEGLNFYIPEHIPIIQKAVESALAGTPYDLELQIMTARGKRLWVRAIGRPIYENDQV
ncbi:MAG TPA: PAS domain-containing protein, partial [Anaerolineales bacterium]|nr:PAS domain-containing protein [Anaerolineales bacterium]